MPKEGEDSLYTGLKDIVGEGFVSREPEELYIYSRDSSANPPRRVDYVVMPSSVEEVQAVVRLASTRGIPLVPMGAALNLEGLTIPLKGGIVVDMRRMDRIIEVSEMDRYALIEAGVSQGKLISYLKENHPTLQHSVPDAPPSATVAGSCLICGYGHLSTNYGTHAEMVNALEVVLPSGELLRTGSAMLPTSLWFGRGSLPDLTGLFLGWLGTTGIVTKLSIRLYPRPPIRDMVIYMMQDCSIVPDVVYRITHTEMAEDVSIVGQERPEWMKGYQIIAAYVSAHTREELALKKKYLKRISEKDFKARVSFMEEAPGDLKEQFMELPFFATKVADWKKGGGFEYVGAIMPIDTLPEAWEKGIEIAHRYNMLYSYAIRVVEGGHHVLFTYSYPFNRADETSMQSALAALRETQKLSLDLGAIPWKPEAEGQKEIIKRMDKGTFALMQRVRKLLDPKGIMNPGNWEVD